MKNKLKNNAGITLIALITTVIVIIMITGVSISLINLEEGFAPELKNQANVLNEFYVESNQVENDLITEIDSDYNVLIETENPASDVPVGNNGLDFWNGSLNAPKLIEGMTPVYFNISGEPVSCSIEEWSQKYDYPNKEWANARTEDGSYWVWIPRFAYKIIGDSHDISIIFIDTNNKNAGKKYSTYYKLEDGVMQDYVVHPAFGTNIKNGGSNENIPGFWVAKYEMSKEYYDGTAWVYQIGTDTLTSTTARVVSKPDRVSWRNIAISNAYANSYSYNRSADSHMMKNSEWGAIAYLTQSAYGRNGEEVAQNTSATYNTGTGNITLSTTGNEYGIYDMNGGTNEFVAAFISGASGFSEDKYRTQYEVNVESPSSSNNWIAFYGYRNSRFGDAILETSTTGTGTTAWNGDGSTYPSGSNSFFVRGGNNISSNSSGIFMFGAVSGEASPEYGYRIVLY